MPRVTASTAPRSPFSLADDRVEPARSQTVTYRCPAGHSFTIRLYAEAECIPLRWDCRSCGAAAQTDCPEAVEVLVTQRRIGPSPKTPWQQLRERRSIAQLDALLEERLALLRGFHDTAAATESGDGSDGREATVAADASDAA
jgi:hypothetical protein